MHFAPFGELQVTAKSLLAYMAFHYNINTELARSTVANNGTIAQSGSTAILSTGTETNGSAQLHSRQLVHYISGQGIIVKFSAVFSPGKTGSLQEAGYGNAEDGYFFGYNGVEFGINRRSSVSGEVIDNWVSQADWNKQLSFEFEPSKYNIYAISFQWLGAGVISFQIENRHTGLFEEAHVIRYPNQFTVPSILNPSLPLRAAVSNSGNTSAIVVTIGNMAAYAFGQLEKPGPRHATQHNLAYTATAETIVLAVENMTDVFGGTGNNRSQIKFTHFTYSTEGAKPVTFRIYRCTISGGTSAAIDTNTSIAKKYTGTPTPASQKLWLAIEAAKADNGILSLPEAFEIPPGEALLITAQSAVNSEVNASLSWKELI